MGLVGGGSIPVRVREDVFNVNLYVYLRRRTSVTMSLPTLQKLHLQQGLFLPYWALALKKEYIHGVLDL